MFTDEEYRVAEMWRNIFGIDIVVHEDFYSVPEDLRNSIEHGYRFGWKEGDTVNAFAPGMERRGFTGADGLSRVVLYEVLRQARLEDSFDVLMRAELFQYLGSKYGRVNDNPIFIGRDIVRMLEERTDERMNPYYEDISDWIMDKLGIESGRSLGHAIKTAMHSNRKAQYRSMSDSNDVKALERAFLDKLRRADSKMDNGYCKMGSPAEWFRNAGFECKEVCVKTEVMGRFLDRFGLDSYEIADWKLLDKLQNPSFVIRNDKGATLVLDIPLRENGKDGFLAFRVGHLDKVSKLNWVTLSPVVMSEKSLYFHLDRGEMVWQKTVEGRGLGEAFYERYKKIVSQSVLSESGAFSGKLISSKADTNITKNLENHTAASVYEKYFGKKMKKVEVDTLSGVSYDSSQLTKENLFGVKGKAEGAVPGRKPATPEDAYKELRATLMELNTRTASRTMKQPFGTGGKAVGGVQGLFLAAYLANCDVRWDCNLFLSSREVETAGLTLKDGAQKNQVCFTNRQDAKVTRTYYNLADTSLPREAPNLYRTIQAAYGRETLPEKTARMLTMVGKVTEHQVESVLHHWQPEYDSLIEGKAMPSLEDFISRYNEKYPSKGFEPELNKFTAAARAKDVTESLGFSWDHGHDGPGDSGAGGALKVPSAERKSERKTNRFTNKPKDTKKGKGL